MKVILPMGLLKLWPSVGLMKQVLSICNSTEAQGAWWSSALAENPLTLPSSQLAMDQRMLPLGEPAQYNLVNRISLQIWNHSHFSTWILFNPLCLGFIYPRSKCSKILFLWAMGTLINTKKCCKELLYCQSNFTDQIYSGH